MMDCISCSTPLPSDARFCMTCGTGVTDPGATVPVARRDPVAELQERLARTLAGRYEVRKLLGQGGMAAVFLAQELGLDRPVAIKVLPPDLTRDEGLVERFQREARTAARLDHTNIIPIHRVESEAGLHYFVMKYVPGRSLDDLLEAREPVAVDVAVRILCEAASALGHAHARGVVHRDVKPANIMLDQDDRVVLTDFGISKAGESTHLTQTGMIIGTPHYMAPEQGLGREVDGRADQYALGVVAYQMLAGHCPFEGDSAPTIIYRHIHEPPKSLAGLRRDIPAHFAEVVAIAMAKDPAHRFASMEELVRALKGDADVLSAARARAAAAGLTITSPIAAGPPTPSRIPTVMMDASAVAGAPRQRESRRMILAGAVAAAVAVMAAAGWWMTTANRDGIGVATQGVQLASGDTRGDAAGAPEAVNPPETGGASGKAPDDSARVDGASTGADSADDKTPSRESPAPANRPGRTTGRASNTPAGNRPAAPTTPAPARTAPLTVNAEPYGELYIDDVLIGDTPVTNHPLDVGRTYRVRVERVGYRPRRETITVTAPNPIRRSWVLEPGGPQ